MNKELNKLKKVDIMICLQDWVRGTHIIETKKKLLQSDFWSREQLEIYQLTKLRKLVLFSYEHVPYYRKLFDDINLKPKDVQVLADIKKIPVLTKDIVRREYINLLADNVDINSHKIKLAKTGGTTGMPLKFYKDVQTRNFAWGAYYRWYNWMGIKNIDRKAVLWGDSNVLKKNIFHTFKSKIVNKLSNNLKLSSFNLNENTLPVIAQKLIDYKPVFLRGYLSSILQVAKYFKENNLILPSLKTISSTTETLLPIYRQYIEDVFHVKMFDQYGCGECNSIAFECNAHNGLHINEEHCLLEILDGNNRDCYNKSGRVVLTDLDNYAFPFIRYENGDSAILGIGECKCGRHSRKILSISGRTTDVVYLKDGSAVHGVFFTDLFYELNFYNFEYFTRFQIYQKKKGDFICRLERTKKEIPQEKLDQLKSNLQKFANEVEIEVLNTLDNDKSGKFRYVISDIKN